MSAWLSTSISRLIGGRGGEHANPSFKTDARAPICRERVLAAQKEVEVGFDLVCLSRGAKDELASVHRFIKRHPRMQTWFHPGGKRVLAFCRERFAFAFAPTVDLHLFVLSAEL